MRRMRLLTSSALLWLVTSQLTFSSEKKNVYLSNADSTASYSSLRDQLEAALAPTDRLPRPVPMGVSISTTPTGNLLFAGTAGMRVRSLAIPDLKFILSNNHVMGAIEPTICPNTAPAGTWILQPGTLDIGRDPGNNPFYLAGIKAAHVPVDFANTAFNLVDAAIAVTVPQLAKTEILGIGDPNPAFAVAEPGMAVTKSGRTTGVTSGTVQAVNVIAIVSYGPCGTARFFGQISITPGNFSGAGDSGSVILEQTTGTPVGLLFAASATSTLANHLFFVYLSLGVFVDGPTPVGPTSEGELIDLHSRASARDPRLATLMGIQSRVQENILSIPGVVGMGIGLAEDGSDLEFVVYCRKFMAQVLNSVPKSLEGIPVRLIESGEFRAF